MKPKIKVLVTGGDGFIGRALCSELDKIGIDFLNFNNRADIREFGQVNDAMGQGCTHVVHLAARVSFNNRHRREVFTTNVDGTANVIKAANKLEISRLVLVSSAITCGVSADPVFRINENCYEFHPERDPYCESKLRMEGLVNDSEVPTIILAPTNTRIDLFVDEIEQREVAFAPAGGINLVDVSDVVSGIIKGLRLGIDGHKYILSGHNISYFDLYRMICRIAPYKRDVLFIPEFMRPTIEFAALWSPSKFFTPSVVKASFGYKFYSNDKARDHLGWVPQVPIEQIVAGELFKRYTEVL